MRRPAHRGWPPVHLFTAAVLLLGGVATLGACERGSERSVTQEEPDEQRARAPGALSGAPEAGERGASCEADVDCNGYLRCAGGTCEVPPAVEGERSEDTPVATFYSEAGGDKIAEFYLELAVSNAEQTRGLMFRRQMHPDWGMLFVYDDERPRSFWMENTFIPLDMVFIDAQGRVVSVIEAAEPLTRVPRSSEGAARYVLELNAETAAKEGITPGTVMRLDNVRESFEPETE